MSRRHKIVGPCRACGGDTCDPKLFGDIRERAMSHGSTSDEARTIARAASAGTCEECRLAGRIVPEAAAAAS